MKGLTGLTVAASLLLAAQAATAVELETDMHKVSANPAQTNVRSVMVMSPEQAQAALGSKMIHAVAN